MDNNDQHFSHDGLVERALQIANLHGITLNAAKIDGLINWCRLRASEGWQLGEVLDEQIEQYLRLTMSAAKHT